MKEKDINKLIGRKLGEFREEPAPGLFERIEATLAQGAAPIPAPAPMRRVSLLRRAVYAGAAAVVLLGLMIGGNALLDRNRSAEVSPVASVTGEGGANTEDIRSGTEGAPASTTTTTDIAVAETSTAPAGGKAVRPRTDNEISVPENLKKPIEGDLHTEQIIKSIAENLQPAEESGQVVAAPTIKPIELASITVEPGQADESRNAQQVQAQTHDTRIYTPEYWNEIFKEERRPRRAGRLVASLYGGNFGAGKGDYSTDDPAKLVYSKFAVENKTGMERMDESGDGIYFSQASPAYELPQEDSGTYEMKHRMPFNVGVTLGIPVTEKLSIVTGLNYAYLFSTGKYQKYDINREIHYLGIPVGAAYSLYSTGRFGLYLYGGGMVEKAISARNVIELSTGGGTNRDIENFSVKGVQLSLRAAAGVSFALTKGVYLYIEPGVAYYFERIEQYPTYHTEYPTSFSLTGGIRFGL